MSLRNQEAGELQRLCRILMSHRDLQETGKRTPIALGHGSPETFQLLNEMGGNPALEAYLQECVPDESYTIANGGIRVLDSREMVIEMREFPSGVACVLGRCFVLALEGSGDPYVIDAETSRVGLVESDNLPYVDAKSRDGQRHVDWHEEVREWIDPTMDFANIREFVQWMIRIAHGFGSA